MLSFNNRFAFNQILFAGVLSLFLIIPSETRSSETFKIGVIFSKTGNVAPVSETSYQIARFAAEEINSKGGLLGRFVELLAYDNQSSSIGSKAAAHKAVKDRVQGVIGAIYSSHSLAMADVLEKADIPMISPISTHPGLTRKGDYIFRVCFTDRFQGKVMADFARHQLDIDKAALLVNTNSRYSLGLAEFFTKHFRCNACRVWEFDYQENTTDFTRQLKQIKRIDVQAVFVPGHYRESAYIIKQARMMDIDIPFLGADGWLNRMYSYGGQYIRGNFYATQWHNKIPRSQSRDFVRRYEKRFGRPCPNEPAMALTYDAFMVFARAVKEAGSLNRAHIRERLSDTRNFKGVTGDITFNAHGDPVDKPAVILQFQNNASVYYSTVKP